MSSWCLSRQARPLTPATCILDLGTASSMFEIRWLLPRCNVVARLDIFEQSLRVSRLSVKRISAVVHYKPLTEELLRYRPHTRLVACLLPCDPKRSSGEVPVNLLQLVSTKLSVAIMRLEVICSGTIYWRSGEVGLIPHRNYPNFAIPGYLAR